MRAAVAQISDRAFLITLIVVGLLMLLALPGLDANFSLALEFIIGLSALALLRRAGPLLMAVLVILAILGFVVLVGVPELTPHMKNLFLLITGLSIAALLFNLLSNPVITGTLVIILCAVLAASPEVQPLLRAVLALIGAGVLLLLIRRANRSDRDLTILFIIPTLFLLVFVAIFPLIWSLGLSFTKYNVIKNIPPVGVSFANYDKVLHSKRVWGHFTTTAKFVVVAVFCEFVIGFLFALFLNRKFPGRGLIMTLMLTPMMFPPIVVALFWRFIYEPRWGLVNYFIVNVLQKEAVPWLTSLQEVVPGFPLALVSIIIVDIWMWSPFIMLISLAGLSAIPRYLYEAAEIDRASTWFKFRHITFPLVWPLLLIALLFRTMDAFKLFDLVFILTEGGPGKATEVVSMYLYRVAFRHHNTGEGSALGYIMLVVIIALSNLYIRYLNKATVK